jgi:hypothetical protein
MDNPIFEYKKVGDDTIYKVSRNDFKEIFPPSESIKNLDSIKLVEMITYRSVEPAYIHIFRDKDYSSQLVAEYLSRGFDPEYAYIYKIIHESFEHLVLKKIGPTDSTNQSLLPRTMEFFRKNYYIIPGVVALSLAYYYYSK